MTDSASEGSGGEVEGGLWADSPTTERAFEGNPTATELFDDDDEPFTWDPSDCGGNGDSTESTQIQDQTASDVFGQLQTAVDDDNDEILSEETPEDIIAVADEPPEEPEIDDSLLVDDDELTDLLLTGRTEQEGFQWIENEESPDGDGAGEFDWIDDDSDRVDLSGDKDAGEEAFDWVEDDEDGDDDAEFDWIEDSEEAFDWIDTDSADESIDGDADDVTIGWSDTDAVAEAIGWNEAANQADRSSTVSREEREPTVSVFSWGG